MTKNYNILIADDDSDVIGNCIAMEMQDVPQAQVHYAKTAQETLQQVKANSFDLIFLDIYFYPGHAQGLELISEIQTLSPASKIIMLSGADDQHTVMHSINAGAIDFFSKKDQPIPEITTVIRNFIKSDAASSDDYAAGMAVAQECGATFASPLMAEVFAKVALARRNPDLPVLITGETGVGKEVIARAINIGTGRPKVDVDCAAIPEALFESEFFGHKRGAFTGADRDKLGKFQQAHKGDLFLDEIGNLRLQDKFLRAVQDKVITPVGGTATQKVDVRIIAATNADLVTLAATGKFRHDLLERLKGVWIQIPPLRERPEDIQPLVEALIAKSDKPNVKVAQTCINLLKSFSWPGNVRQLELVVKEMLARCHTDQLTIMQFSQEFKDLLTVDLKLCSNTKPDNGPKSSTPSRFYEIPLQGTLEEVTDQFFASYLLDRFKRLGGNANKTELARDLGVSRNTIIQYVKKLSIALPEIADA